MRVRGVILHLHREEVKDAVVPPDGAKVSRGFVPLLGLLFQWLGVPPASNSFVPMQSYVFFMFYIDEVNPQCKGDLSCCKPSSQTIFIRRVQSYSCEWLKHTSKNGGTPPTVALVRALHLECSHHGTSRLRRCHRHGSEVPTTNQPIDDSTRSSYIGISTPFDFRN